MPLGLSRWRCLASKRSRTLADLAKDQQWQRKAGKLVKPIVEEKHPFGVDLELLLGANPERYLAQKDRYHFHYVLAGSGLASHWDVGAAASHRERAVEEDDSLKLTAGDFFVVAPNCPYYIGASSSLLMLSVSINTVSNERQKPKQIIEALESNADSLGCLVSSRLRSTKDLLTFQLPNQRSRIALVFDPFRDCIPFTCSMEILEPGYVIPSHAHPAAFELFIILSGTAELILDGQSIMGQQGETFLVHPKRVHSVGNSSGSKELYMLSIIMESRFAELVWNSECKGKINDSDVVHLLSKDLV